MNLEEIKIGKGVEYIEEGLLKTAEKLTAVTLGDNIKMIASNAFESTKYINDVSEYQNGLLISSDKYLIKVAPDVTDCVIPSGVEIIASGAFEKVSTENGLSEIILPSSLERLSLNSLRDIPKDTPIRYRGTIEDFCEISTFDESEINLYTLDDYSIMWAIIITAVVFAFYVVELIISNCIKSKRNKEYEYEDD